MEPLEQVSEMEPVRPDSVRRTKMFAGFVVGAVLLGVHVSQIIGFLLLFFVADWDWFVTLATVTVAGWIIGRVVKLPRIYFWFQLVQFIGVLVAGVFLSVAQVI